MKSRKILVPIDIENPTKKINDILIPIMDDNSVFLFGYHFTTEDTEATPKDFA